MANPCNTGTYVERLLLRLHYHKSWKDGIICGVTNDLPARMQEYFNNRGKPETFAGKYYCYMLVYYERYPNVKVAIAREKELKDLSREKKAGLINELNPHWNMLVVS